MTTHILKCFKQASTAGLNIVTVISYSLAIEVGVHIFSRLMPKVQLSLTS